MRYRDMQRDRPTGRYERRSDAWLPRDGGDPTAAFSELYSRHVGTVHAGFHRRLEWAASDLTAETLTRAWLSRDRFRDDREGSALPGCSASPRTTVCYPMGSCSYPSSTGGFAAASKPSKSPSSPGGTLRTAINWASTLEGERG